MALVSIVAVNQTVVAIPLTQLYATNSEIPASTSVTLTEFNRVEEILGDEQLLTLIQNDEILLNVNTIDLTKEQSLVFLDAPTVAVKTNYEDSQDPTATDDEAAGYSVGSIWITTAGVIYFCIDATATAAVWQSPGDVTGPGSSEVYELPQFADTTGKIIAGSGIRMYPAGAADPVPGGGVPTPSDGDLYFNTTLKMLMFYDGSRSKWLSLNETVIIWARSGNTAGGSYFKAVDGITYSVNNGFYTEFNGTVVSMAYTRDDTDSAIFEVHSNGAFLAGAAIASTAVSGSNTAIDADFTSSVVLGVYNNNISSTVTNCMGRFRLRWRI
jgi:hypothetical protein